MAEPDRTPLALARLAVLYVFVFTLLALARPTLPWVGAGAVVIGLGEALRLWSAGHLIKNEVLVTSGPYRHTRNPLYLGRLLIFTGLCLAASLPFALNWPVLLAGYAVFFGYYLPRKERVEPARLRALHGKAFDQYRREVPSLLPRLRAWPGGSTAPWSARQALKNREHWMVAGLAAAIVFLLWRA